MIEQKSESGRNMANNLIPFERLKQLTNLSIETLESLLKDSNIPPQERAAIAFKVLEMTGVSPQTLNTSVHSASQNGSSASPQLQRTPAPTSDTQSIIQTDSVFLNGDYVWIENFLSPEYNQKIVEIALSKKEQFVGSKTTTQAANYRQSSILYATLFPDFYEFFRKKLLQTVPTVLEKLNHPTFTVSQVEMQLTAHNDGCFYKIHNDSGSKKTATRMITYVYYFNQEPKQYSGGELRIYETELRAGSALSNSQFKSVEPRNNSIVFFDSRCKHEVMPVRCPSQQFEDGRFTLNGWFRRTENQEDSVIHNS